MHELSLAIPIGEYVLKESEGHTVTKIDLQIGALSGIVPEALDLALHVVLQDTAAADAVVAYLVKSGQGQCRYCGTDFTMNDVLDACPRCGELGARILSGMQVFLTGLAFSSGDAVATGHFKE